MHHLQKQSVLQCVRNCEVCQEYKVSTQAPAGLLQPLPVPDSVWSDISMDFIEGLPKSQQFDTIFVVVDRFTKYSHFISMRHPYTAETVAAVFVREIVRLHGFPTFIVSDRDIKFVSYFWKTLWKLFGTQLKFSFAFHPQADGQTKVTNRSLGNLLLSLVGDKPGN